MPDPESPEPRPPISRPSKPRPSISVLMECCNTYVKIYLNAVGDAYAGHCPRCATPVRVRVGPGGSTDKVFRAG